MAFAAQDLFLRNKITISRNNSIFWSDEIQNYYKLKKIKIHMLEQTEFIENWKFTIKTGKNTFI